MLKILSIGVLLPFLWVSQTFADDNDEAFLTESLHMPNSNVLADEEEQEDSDERSEDRGYILPTVAAPLVVIDLTPPTITVQQAAITIQALSPQSLVHLGMVTAIDLVDGIVLPTNNAPTTFPLGVTVVTYTAADLAGNVGMAQQVVTVQDTTPPVVTPPTDVVTISATGQSLVVAIGLARATDLFTPIQISNDAPAVFPIGNTTVTWTAMDANGNAATATQMVTVQDTSLFASLPPDPGVAGQVTLAGIDSDNDGVRDDVQRWITMNYPNSEKTRAALSQLAQDYQRFVVDATNPTKIYEAARLMGNTNNCLSYIDFRSAYSKGGLLKAQVLDTYARSRSFLKADRHLSGRMYKGLSYSNRKKGCRFNPDNMLN